MASDYIKEGFPHSLQTNPIPEGVAIHRIHGPFLFGAADKLRLIEDAITTLPKVVILRFRNMTAIDATGLHALESLADKLVASDLHLILCKMRDQPGKLMEQADFHERIGHANIYPTLEAALDRARSLLAPHAEDVQQ